MGDDVLGNDEVLNYERICYSRGFSEGQAAGEIQGHTEGRELGIQTGFQRYLPLGILQGRVGHWTAQLGDEPQSSAKLLALQRLCESRPLINDPDAVEDVERRIKLATNKARALAIKLNDPPIQTHAIKISYQRADDAIEDI